MKFFAFTFLAVFAAGIQPAFADSNDTASASVIPSAAAPVEPIKNETPLSRWRDEATGYFADHGLTFQGMSIHDISTPPSGSEGSSPGWFGRYSLDLSATIEGQKAMRLPGFQATVHLKQHLREFGAGDENVAQPYSNIDADSRTTLYGL
jgi:hypothetical protein